MPSNTDFVRCQPAPCSHLNGIVSWQPGDLPAGGTDLVTLVVDVHRNLDPGTVLTNRARIHIFDTPAYSATAALTTTVVSTPDLWVQVSDGQTAVQAGQDLAYNITYGNAGSGRAFSTTLRVTPPLPAYVENVGCVPSAGCQWLGGQLHFDLGTVAGGESGDVQVVATVRDPLPAGASGLTVTVVLTTVTPGDAPGDNTAQDYDAIATRPDLHLRTDYHSHTPYPGKRLTYTVHYSNTGHIATTGVGISVTLSPHVTFDAGASSAWQSLGDRRYWYDVGNLDYNQSGTLWIVVTLPQDRFAPSMANFDAAFEIYDDGGSGADANQSDNLFLAPLGVPDIVIEGIEVNLSSLLSHQTGSHVTVTLKNVGTNMACNPVDGNGPDFCGPFYVDLYINPDPAPPPYGPPFGDAYYDRAGPITPGQSIQVSFYPFALPQRVEAPVTLYVRVDNFELSRPYGLVPEYDEDNNVYGPVIVGYGIYLPVILRR